MEIMRGDSRQVFVDLKQDGQTLNPSMIVELEVSVGHRLRKLYSEREVAFDEERSCWYFRLTQEETLTFYAHEYDVVVRAKYLDTPDSDVLGVKIGTITITDAPSKAVL